MQLAPILAPITQFDLFKYNLYLFNILVITIRVVLNSECTRRFEVSVMLTDSVLYCYIALIWVLISTQ